MLDVPVVHNFALAISAGAVVPFVLNVKDEAVKGVEVPVVTTCIPMICCEVAPGPTVVIFDWVVVHETKAIGTTGAFKVTPVIDPKAVLLSVVEDTSVAEV